MSNDVTSFIADLQNLANKEQIKITVPSLNKEVKFKPLTVKQQKEALKASLTGVQGTVLFFNVLNSILEENCSEDIDFTIQDRAYVMIQLRNNALGTSYKKDNKIYDLNLPFVAITDKEDLKIEYKGISVSLEIPSLKKDTTINSKCAQEIKNKQAEDIGDILDVLYAYEIIKFIKEIHFNDEVINFTSLSYKEKRDIVDMLPLSLNKLILTKITAIKSYDDNYLHMDGDELTLDVSFLTGD